MLLPLIVNSSDIKGCKHYKSRGLICRMFGYSGYADNNGDVKLATCRLVKEFQAHKIDAAQQ